MKSILKVCFAVAAPVLVSLSGCASGREPLMLGEVGPAAVVPPASPQGGTLRVYSAFETGPLSPSVPENINQHTQYTISTEGGEPLRTVANRAGPWGEEPESVLLPPGHYQVEALANGNRYVKVPVLIVTGRITSVHLDNGASRDGLDAVNPADAVRLPGGQVVGWRAEPAASPGAGRN